MSLKRTLWGLAAACLLLWAADRFLQSREDARRRSDSVFVPLAGPAATVDKVAAVLIGVPPAGWRYALVEGKWRCLDANGSLVHPDAMKALLDGLLKGAGTVVSRDKRDLVRYGLVAGEILRVRLLDAAGKSLLEADVGRGLPGLEVNESYVHLAGAQEIMHLHFNPRLVAASPDGKRPPMLDPFILPKAFERHNAARIAWSFDKYPLKEMYMIQLSTGPRRMPEPGKAPEMPTILWKARTNDGVIDLDVANAGAYAAFLERVRWDAVLDGGDDLARVFKPVRGTITLTDTEKNQDVLEIGQDLEGGGTMVKNRRAGLIYVINSNKIPLLFPPYGALAGKKPVAPLLMQAEPY